MSDLRVNGFILPHALIDHWAKILDPFEFMILAGIIRKIHGWHKQETGAKIGINELCKMFPNIGRSTLVRKLNNLEETHGLIVVTRTQEDSPQNTGKKVNNPNHYILSDYFYDRRTTDAPEDENAGGSVTETPPDETAPDGEALNNGGSPGAGPGGSPGAGPGGSPAPGPLINSLFKAISLKLTTQAAAALSRCDLSEKEAAKLAKKHGTELMQVEAEKLSTALTIPGYIKTTARRYYLAALEAGGFALPEGYATPEEIEERKARQLAAKKAAVEAEHREARERAAQAAKARKGREAVEMILNDYPDFEREEFDSAIWEELTSENQFFKNMLADRAKDGRSWRGVKTLEAAYYHKAAEILTKRGKLKAAV